MVITGAGEGIMEAGHRGPAATDPSASTSGSRSEQAPNEVIENDPGLILFHYFFTRKLFFVKEADGLVFFPRRVRNERRGVRVDDARSDGKSEMVRSSCSTFPAGPTGGGGRGS